MLIFFPKKGFIGVIFYSHEIIHKALQMQRINPAKNIFFAGELGLNTPTVWVLITKLTAKHNELKVYNATLD